MLKNIEELEHNRIKMTVEIPAEEVAAMEEAVFQEEKGNFVIQGFRKGKAPRKMIEQVYGKGIFLQDAVDRLLREEYPKAYDEAAAKGYDIVTMPEINLVQVESGQALIFEATAMKKPEVQLADYKNLKLDEEKYSAEVTEEEIDAALQEAREGLARIVPADRPVKDGDLIRLDFLGKVDGVAFEGGEAQDYDLTIGSHSFIDGFEEQLIGMSVGETKDIEVTFPEAYHAEELAGKPAVFTCTIKDVKEKELPPLDDEFAEEASEFDTLEEYRTDIIRQLQEEKQEKAAKDKKDAYVELLSENTQMDIPEEWILEEAQAEVDNFGQQIASQGVTLDDYLQHSGQTKEDLIASVKEPALKQIKGRLVLEAVAKAENLTVSEEELEKELTAMAEEYGMDVEQIKNAIGQTETDALKEDILRSKALDFLYEVNA